MYELERSGHNGKAKFNLIFLKIKNEVYENKTEGYSYH